MKFVTVLASLVVLLLIYNAIGNEISDHKRKKRGHATFNSALEDSIVAKENYGNPEGHIRWMLTGANYFHHSLMDAVIPILKTSPSNSTWLTIGDSRFCYESAYIKHLSKNLSTHVTVMGSSLRNDTCYYTLNAGLIDKFSLLNVEAIELDDDSFDFVLTKESFHHFYRPYLGVYEMLRVARHGVILIEPSESALEKFESNIARDERSENLANSILRKPIRTNYEHVGYQFNINPMELRKIALALGYKYIAFQGNNSPTGPKTKEEFIAARDKLNELGKQGKRYYNLITAVIFKREPSGEMLKALEESDFLVLKLPQSAKDMQTGT
jgi:SAM-dependent methyltransferase